MKACYDHRWLLAIGLVVVASVPGARGDDPPSDRQKRLDRQIQDSFQWYQMLSGPGSTNRLKSEPVLKWVNDPRGQEGEATLLLWTAGGRPEALTSVYGWRGHLAHEVVSLAREEGLVVRDGDRTLWSFGKPGVSFREIPGAPAPAETPAARLKQIRTLAGRFQATMTGWKAGDGDREVLRMLPKPIHRYDLEAEKPAAPDLIDGAVFAFVQGTDPEAVLMIEALRRDGKPAWQYAFGRSTYASLEAKLDGSVVWNAPKLGGQNDPRYPMFGMSRPQE